MIRIVGNSFAIFHKRNINQIEEQIVYINGVIGLTLKSKTKTAIRLFPRVELQTMQIFKNDLKLHRFPCFDGLLFNNFNFELYFLRMVSWAKNK